MHYEAFLSPYGHDFTELAQVLLKYRQERIVYVPNPGNSGDALIALGTYLLFERLGLSYENGKKDEIYPNRVVVYGGGGGLVNLYPDADAFLRSNHAVCRALILLPHTVRTAGDLLGEMDERCVLFAREMPSLEFLNKHCKRGAKAALSHDLAFFVTRENISQESWNWGRLADPLIRLPWAKMLVKFFVISKLQTRNLNIFRTDDEKTSFPVPAFNYDIAPYFWPGDLTRPAVTNSVKGVSKVIDFFDSVASNRLHMSVLGGILGKEVVMHDNSYGKNFSIYRHSIDGYLLNIRTAVESNPA